MRKRYPILATAAVVALITVPLAAQAHDGAVQASCSGASIHLTNYPAGGVITGTVDGKPIGYTTFEHTYDNTVQWDPTVNHSYNITVTANDNYPTKHYSEEITGCAPTETPTPVGTPQPSSEPSSTPQPTREPTGTPTDTSSASPSPSSTPSPVVTPNPTGEPSTPSSPTGSASGSPSIEPTAPTSSTPAPTTPPRSTAPTSTKPTPRTSTTATDAPVATPVVAPAEFTG